MIPDTPIDFLLSLPKDLEALYDWVSVIGDEAYNTMNSVAGGLTPVTPADLQTIVDVMDDMKNKLASLKNLADKIHHNLEDNEDEQEESK